MSWFNLKHQWRDKCMDVRRDLLHDNHHNYTPTPYTINHLNLYPTSTNPSHSPLTTATTTNLLHTTTTSPQPHHRCVICMGDFIIGDRMRYLPCVHMYHKRCIDDWLMRSFTCPSCMEPVDSALLMTYQTNWRSTMGVI